jgi:cholinesterase
MNPIKKFMLIALMIGLLAAGCAGPANKPITQVVVFGDSLSDNGAGAVITEKDVEDGVAGAALWCANPVYWQGRCSNGPVAVEVLAEHLNVKLADYAIAGAMSNELNAIGIGNLVQTGMLSQVRKYQADLGGIKADPNALYVIIIGGNDEDGLSLYSYGKITDAVADDTIANIQKVITDLTTVGAKRFLVSNVFDLSKQPGTIANKTESYNKAYQVRLDSQLPKKMADLAKQLKVEINVFDFQAAEDKIRSDPAKYGITNTSEGCLPNMISTKVCANPDEHYYWDPYHPSRVVQKIIGEEMAKVYGK